jgi:hypothetical protein
MDEQGANMLRKMLVIAAAITIPVSVVAVGGGLASAANAHSAGTDTITCKTLTGSLAFSPKIDAAGYKSGHISTKVTATLTGCTVKGSPPITITKGTVTGTLVGATGTSGKATGTCTGLSGNGTETGTLTTVWTASKGGPVPKSTLGVKSDIGGHVGSGSSEHGTFTIPGSTKGTAGGSFLGSNHGMSDKAVAESSQTYSTVAANCLRSGLNTLKIQNESSTPALSLG